MNLLPVPANL
jgi:U3 small nucleolar RNA-associated protein 3